MPVSDLAGLVDVARRLALAAWFGGALLLAVIAGPFLAKRLPDRRAAASVLRELMARFALFRFALATLLVALRFVPVAGAIDGGWLSIVWGMLPLEAVVSCLLLGASRENRVDSDAGRGLAVAWGLLLAGGVAAALLLALPG